MKNRRKNFSVFGLILGVLTLASCGNQDDAEVKDAIISTTEARRQMMAKIDSLESIVYVDSFNYQAKSTSELLKTYNEFTEKFVGDKEKTPEYLYKAAALCRATRLPVKAIKYYDKILSDYPNFERNPEVAFLMAFTYDEDLNQKDRAKEAYQEVIEKFPGDKWAEQASARLKTIDMTDEELIQSFMKKDGIDKEAKEDTK